MLHCILIDCFYFTGINDISEILKENHALQILNVGDNAIGDDGVMQLTEGLQCNVTLTELRLDECVLTLKGEHLPLF